jgi:ribosome-associated protein
MGAMVDATHLVLKAPGGEIRIPLGEVSLAFARSGGPGGQNVNKVETKVEVRFSPAASSALTSEQATRIAERLANRMTKDGEIVLTASETRSREQNRMLALGRLETLLTGALARRKRRKPTRPTRASRERRLRGKKRRGERKRLRRPPPEE